MKRIVTLMLAAMLVLGSVAGASAAEIKAKGQWDFSFQFLDNTDFRSEEHGGQDKDTFTAVQRLRTQIDIIASESLRGVVFFEMGNTTWGKEDGALGADGKSVEVKRSYIDWAVPDTGLMVRMGLQGLALPWAVSGSPVFDDDVAALTLSYKFSDMVSTTAFWARPYDSSTGEEKDANKFDEIDLFGLLLPVTLDGAKITPWAMYGSIGKDIGSDGINGYSAALVSKGLVGGLGEDTTAWWLGTAFELSMFSPLSFKLDAVYGAVKGDDVLDAERERSGWLVFGAIDYKMDMMTPGIFALYSTGDDDDAANGSERMPYVSPTDFGPTSFGLLKGAAPIAKDGLISASGTGMWMIGAQLADISFIENLKHTLRLAYMTGTNDAELIKRGTLDTPVIDDHNGLYMTDNDHAWEVNFDHFYKIYDNLDLMVEMGYIKADFDEATWKNSKFDDAWKLGFNLKYSF